MASASSRCLTPTPTSGDGGSLALVQFPRRRRQSLRHWIEFTWYRPELHHFNIFPQRYKLCTLSLYESTVPITNKIRHNMFYCSTFKHPIPIPIYCLFYEVGNKMKFRVRNVRVDLSHEKKTYFKERFNEDCTSSSVSNFHCVFYYCLGRPDLLAWLAGSAPGRRSQPGSRGEPGEPPRRKGKARHNWAEPSVRSRSTTTRARP